MRVDAEGMDPVQSLINYGYEQEVKESAAIEPQGISYNEEILEQRAAETKTQTNFHEVWLQYRAVDGDPKAQYHLGMHYIFYHETQKEGAEWLKKAADQGNIRAKFELARAYHEGKGVHQDDDTAYRLLFEATGRTSTREGKDTHETVEMFIIDAEKDVYQNDLNREPTPSESAASYGQL